MGFRTPLRPQLFYQELYLMRRMVAVTEKRLDLPKAAIFFQERSSLLLPGRRLMI